MPHVIVKIIRERDDALVFFASYPADQFSVSVTHEGKGDIQSNGVPAGVHAEAEGQTKEDAAERRRRMNTERMRRKRAVELRRARGEPKV